MISFKDVYNLLYPPNDAYDVVHQLISINSLNFQLTITLHTLFVVSLLASQAIVVSARNNSDWVIQLVPKRTLNLRNNTIVQML